MSLLKLMDRQIQKKTDRNGPHFCYEVRHSYHACLLLIKIADFQLQADKNGGILCVFRVYNRHKIKDSRRTVQESIEKKCFAPGKEEDPKVKLTFWREMELTITQCFIDNQLPQQG